MRSNNEKRKIKMKEKVKKIPCHICKKMIPKAAAVHAEGRDYVLHFCDIDCLDYWKKEQEEKKKK
jgi:ribosomal protein S26